MIVDRVRNLLAELDVELDRSDLIKEVSVFAERSDIAEEATADAFLLARGVVLRRVDAYGLPNALRMTIGSAEANEAVIAGLTAFMGQAGGREGSGGKKA